MNDRIDELIKVNTELQKENKDLQIKMSKFDSWLENYVKILAESKEQSKWKSEAYDIALNQIKYWAWITWGILSIVWILFWIWRGKELKTARETFESEIKDYREYITKIDETLIKSSIISNFDVHKNWFITELTTYINTNVQDEITSKILADINKEIKPIIKDELQLNEIQLKDKIMAELKRNKNYYENNFDNLDAFEGMSL